MKFSYRVLSVVKTLSSVKLPINVVSKAVVLDIGSQHKFLTRSLVYARGQFSQACIEGLRVVLFGLSKTTNLGFGFGFTLGK